ncbi:unnamed protein product [Spirodela intermedia]|uniref:Uncharacterized protein n=1 Tax=Spirodela intermedia TaxID=51605 RepID=A0A7I8JUX2_SPIIN|nr:unnamed protein product [Spirodela intermedia]CAA6673252.1 unnamed protein product [Spirodela intermedia]
MLQWRYISDAPRSEHLGGSSCSVYGLKGSPWTRTM